MDKAITIGVFDDVSKAERAVADAVAAGVSENDITVFLSDDEPEAAADLQARAVVHATNNSDRGHVGGGFGAALGGLLGSIALYLASRYGGIHTQISFLLGIVFGGIVGMVTGSLISRYLPSFTYYFAVLSRRERLRSEAPRRQHDNWRSAAAGAIGGLLGSQAGVLAAYLMGIPNWWFFIQAGLWAGAASLVVGGLVGAMSGRGLAPRGMGIWEALVDEGHKVMVSVESRGRSNGDPRIEDLLRRDGALLIRTA